ncbi:MAG TPA: molybdate ABC transporter substrate-binding protein [Candidatus Binataceae bacterium]|nr:molybdate ABC transporter substrate-binding protein [Candidatus Binataceae bacterium]
MGIFALIMMVGWWAPGSAEAETITIAAAADLTFAFKEVVPQFEHESGDTVKLSFGSSGNFFAQIQNGAPYDLFFSADIGYPKKLEAAGLTEPGTLYEYAVGKIVLWVLNQSPLDVSKGLTILTDSRVNKIAIADPAHAPYGRAAVEALKHEKLYDEVKSKLVQGENIAQTAQFVQSGSADIGILALSLALAPTLQKEGRYGEIPGALYAPIEQAAVVLKASKKKPVAEAFLAFLQKPGTVALMKRYGFMIPAHPQ